MKSSSEDRLNKLLDDLSEIKKEQLSSQFEQKLYSSIAMIEAKEGVKWFVWMKVGLAAMLVLSAINFYTIINSGTTNQIDTILLSESEVIMSSDHLFFEN